MEIIDVVTKLIGPIRPLGCEARDPERLENLKTMCDLVEKLTDKISEVADQVSYEESVKRAQKYANDFLTYKLGVRDE
jgi:hypothetical protein